MNTAFEEIEAAAGKLLAEEKAHLCISGARKSLIMGRNPAWAFFALLALRLELKPDWAVETAATDGVKLVYNPRWFASLAEPERRGVVAHEVMHNAFGHHVRRQGRDVQNWNVACDLAINDIITSAGLSLPPGALKAGTGRYAAFPKGLAAESYFELLQKQQEDPSGSIAGESSTGTDPGQCGGVADAAGTAAEQEASAAQWRAATTQAGAVAQGRGELPEFLAKAIAAAVKVKADCWDVLRDFFSRTAANDYAWTPPDVRFLGDGLYLPSLHSDEVGAIGVAVDASGSIDDDELAVFAAHLAEVAELYRCQLTILYHNTQVTRVQEWSPIDGSLELSAVGGGGTSHVPVFEWFNNSGEQYDAVVCFTDMQSRFPEVAPSYPVLWAKTGDCGREAGFGMIMQIE